MFYCTIIKHQSLDESLHSSSLSPDTMCAHPLFRLIYVFLPDHWMFVSYVY